MLTDLSASSTAFPQLSWFVVVSCRLTYESLFWLSHPFHLGVFTITPPYVRVFPATASSVPLLHIVSVPRDMTSSVFEMLLPPRKSVWDLWSRGWKLRQASLQ